MSRYLFLAVILFFCWSNSVSVQAAPIPILGSHAKYKPGLARKNMPPVDSGLARVVVLGNFADISEVKTRGNDVRRHRRVRKKVASKVRFPGKITAKSVMVLNADTGETIYARNPDLPRQPASTIKVLTGMIAIKSLKKNDLVRVTRHAEQMPRSKIYLDRKKRYRADDLINAVLLASANDASVALAERIAGSEKKFAHMMTLRARLWGAKKTICRTANGLTARGQQTTARDLAHIFRHAMQDKDFARRMRKTKIKTSYGQLLRNHNKALWTVKGALGGKTGYTYAARQTYVGKFKRGKDAIVVAIMGSDTMWSDIKRLVEYGFKKNRQLKMARLAKAESGQGKTAVH